PPNSPKLESQSTSDERLPKSRQWHSRSAAHLFWKSKPRTDSSLRAAQIPTFHKSPIPPLIQTDFSVRATIGKYDSGRLQTAKPRPPCAPKFWARQSRLPW